MDQEGRYQVLVVNDKVLVRELKEAYKGWGYSVMVIDNDQWVFRSADNWVVMIEGQDNVPNEVLTLIVLHMGHLPKEDTCHRIYKGEKCSVIQKEAYAVAEETWRSWQKMRMETDDCPVEIRRTPLVYGRRRVWQERESKSILLMNPRFEGLMHTGGDSMIRKVGENICLEGEISEVYISRARGGASEDLLDHLAQVSWT